MVGDGRVAAGARRWWAAVIAVRERPRILYITGAWVAALILFGAAGLLVALTHRDIAWRLLIALGIAKPDPNVIGGWQAHSAVAGLAEFLVAFVPLWLALEVVSGVVVEPVSATVRHAGVTTDDDDDDQAGTGDLRTWLTAVQRGVGVAALRIALAPAVWVVALLATLIATTALQFGAHWVVERPDPRWVSSLPIVIGGLALWLARVVLTAPVTQVWEVDPVSRLPFRDALGRARRAPGGAISRELRTRGVPLFAFLASWSIALALGAVSGTWLLAAGVGVTLTLGLVVAAGPAMALHRESRPVVHSGADAPSQSAEAGRAWFTPRVGPVRLAVVLLVVLALAGGSAWIRHADVLPPEDDPSPAVNASRPDRAVVNAALRTRASSHTAVKRVVRRPANRSAEPTLMVYHTLRLNWSSGRARGVTAHTFPAENGTDSRASTRRWRVMSVYTSETATGVAFNPYNGSWPDRRRFTANWSVTPNFDVPYPFGWPSPPIDGELDWRLADRTRDRLVFETTNASRGHRVSSSGHLVRSRVVVDRSSGYLRRVVTYTREPGSANQTAMIRRSVVRYSGYGSTTVRRPGGPRPPLEYYIDQLVYGGRPLPRIQLSAASGS